MDLRELNKSDKKAKKDKIQYVKNNLKIEKVKEFWCQTKV